MVRGGAGQSPIRKSCDARFVWVLNAAGVEFLIGRLAVDIRGDSSLSGSLIFATWSAVVEERDGGDWTGSASSGDVIDLPQGGMCE
jgi:hypothetical protein